MYVAWLLKGSNFSCCLYDWKFILEANFCTINLNRFIPLWFCMTLLCQNIWLYFFLFFFLIQLNWGWVGWCPTRYFLTVSISHSQLGVQMLCSSSSSWETAMRNIVKEFYKIWIIPHEILCKTMVLALWLHTVWKRVMLKLKKVSKCDLIACGQMCGNSTNFLRNY